MFQKSTKLTIKARPLSSRGMLPKKLPKLITNKKLKRKKTLPITRKLKK